MIKRKIIAAILSLCCVTCCVITGSMAENGDRYVFEYPNETEVVVEINDELTYEQHKQIADNIAGVSPMESLDEADSIMLNPQCEAGNHLLAYTNSFSTVHNVYTTDPKCVLNTYLVGKCKRSNCLYEIRTLISSERISCH